LFSALQATKDYNSLRQRNELGKLDQEDSGGCRIEPAQCGMNHTAGLTQRARLD
jgi:hypothetical protein